MSKHLWINELKKMKLIIIFNYIIVQKNIFLNDFFNINETKCDWNLDKMRNLDIS